MSVSDSSLMAAVRFRSGEAIDSLFAVVVARLRENGTRVAGILQEESAARDGGRAVTWLRDVTDGTRVQLSQDLGPHGRGCRLDPAALAAVAGRLAGTLESGVDLLVANRFGRAESEGGGLRALIERAAIGGVPVLIAVREDYAAAWDGFHGGLAVDVANEPEAILAWCTAALRPGGAARVDGAR